MKVWIIVLALLLLVALILRERFTTYEEALKSVGQTAGYINPTCPQGYTIDSDMLSCEMTNEDGTKDVKSPTCPSGSNYVKRGSRGICEPTAPPTPSATSTSTPEAASQTSSMPAATTSIPGATANTSTSPAAATGGTSGNLIGPTSGGRSGSEKKIWGPVFTGRDTSMQETGGDSTKSNVYPELLGGLMGKTSARIDGVGIVSPSQPGLTTTGGFGLDMGTLPSSASLGTDALSRFLPFSRQPGDMDIVPDPYRLAKNFSTKNYSSEKDPVPFLTDFSAFYK